MSYPATPSAPASPVRGLSLDVHVRRGRFDLTAAFDAAPGEVIGLLGPNGSGKTTVLDTIAGFAQIDHGFVRVDDATWDDGTRRLPARARGVGLLTARGDLFPHLDVIENVAFGLRARGVARRAARARAEEEIAAVGLSGFERRRPATLSSGQAQRVALARALVLAPSVLLLDEPLSAVDAEGRHDLRALLSKRLGTSTAATLLVTHDPIEALTLADRLVVLDAGRVAQIGAPRDVVQRPRSTFAARLVGLNVWAGDIDGSILTTGEGHRIVAAAPPDGSATAQGPSAVPRAAGSAARPAAVPRGFAAFAPQAVSLWPQRPEGSPRNTWRVAVESVEHIGTRVRVRLTGDADLVAEVTLDAVADLGLQRGRQMYATVKATDVTLYR